MRNLSGGSGVVCCGVVCCGVLCCATAVDPCPPVLVLCVSVCYSAGMHSPLFIRIPFPLFFSTLSRSSLSPLPPSSLSPSPGPRRQGLEGKAHRRHHRSSRRRPRAPRRLRRRRRRQRRLGPLAQGKTGLGRPTPITHVYKFVCVCGLLGGVMCSPAALCDADAPAIAYTSSHNMMCCAVV